MKHDGEPGVLERMSTVLRESSGGRLDAATRDLLARRILDELEKTYKLVRRTTPNLILFMDPRTGEVHYDGEPQLLTKAISQLVDLKLHDIGTQE
jgi:hypothetical protein